MPEITYMLRISSWNFECVHTYKVSAWNSHKKYDCGNIQMSREANLKDMVRIKEPHGVSRPNTELFMSQCLLSVTQIITATKDCITHTITPYFLVCISVLRVVRQKHAYWYQLNLLPEKLCTSPCSDSYIRIRHTPKHNIWSPGCWVFMVRLYHTCIFKLYSIPYNNGSQNCMLICYFMQLSRSHYSYQLSVVEAQIQCLPGKFETC